MEKAYYEWFLTSLYLYEKKFGLIPEGRKTSVPQMQVFAQNLRNVYPRECSAFLGYCDKVAPQSAAGVGLDDKIEQIACDHPDLLRMIKTPRGIRLYELSDEGRKRGGELFESFPYLCRKLMEQNMTAPTWVTRKVQKAQKN